MKRLLFVDDERRILDGLRRMLRSQRGQWEMEFVESGAEALARCTAAPLDVVVTDMRMPSMDGAALLREIAHKSPGTIRIVLSGQCDRATVLSTVATAHQFLTKPCNPEVLIATLSRACAHRDALAEERHRLMVGQIAAVPSLPARHAELVAEAASPGASVERIGAIVAADVGMSAKIGQLVNTSFFGAPRRVACPKRAADLFDLDTLRAMVLSTPVFAPFDSAITTHGILEVLTEHALAVAASARRIAEMESDDPSVAHDAYWAGMLHDVGLHLLASRMPECFEKSIRDWQEGRAALPDLEQGMLGTTHADIGAYLMALWGFPDPVTEAIWLHHAPARSTQAGFSPLTAVHVADAFDQGRVGGPRAVSTALDRAYLARLGLEGRLDAWWTTLQEPMPQGVCR
ncbi:MAG: response regulator [Thermoguttaceae bacterium]|nr:response regulator [Thermoguttaceae bacterium]